MYVAWSAARFSEMEHRILLLPVMERKGTKRRSLNVDTGGLPHGIKETTADVRDREGAIEMLRC